MSRYPGVARTTIYWATHPRADVLTKERPPIKRKEPALRVVQELLELEIRDRVAMPLREPNDVVGDGVSRGFCVRRGHCACPFVMEGTETPITIEV